MNDVSILVSAIADVGYWNWWTGRLPDVFQVEFGGAQIYVPPSDNSKPPTSLLALRFRRVVRVGFMRRSTGVEFLPADWPRLLQENKLDSTGISHDEFALNDDEHFSEVISKAKSEIPHFTSDRRGKIRLAFWAGIVGLRVEADEMCPVLMSGETDFSTIASMHEAWWQYWRDYWAKRGTSEALPKDFSCEVTIPSQPK